MKWVLVVYFFVLGPDGGWFTAEEMGRQSWYRTNRRGTQLAEEITALGLHGSDR